MGFGLLSGDPMARSGCDGTSRRYACVVETVFRSVPLEDFVMDFPQNNPRPADWLKSDWSFPPGRPKRVLIFTHSSSELAGEATQSQRLSCSSFLESQGLGGVEVDSIRDEG